MPSKIKLELIAEKEVELPRFTGYVSRGLLLTMLRRIEPTTSDRLHVPNASKPYSVTPIRFRSQRKTPKGYLLDPSIPARVEFRFLSDEPVRRLLDYFADRAGVLVYDTEFKVASITIGSATYEELESSEPTDAFRLLFRSPTYLSAMGSRFDILYPDPIQLFTSLLRLWDIFTTGRKYGPEGLEEYREWLRAHAGVTQHALRTRLAEMARKRAVGFTGWATYSLDTDDDWNRLTVTLARFAEYSNIGGNRTGGFGEIKFHKKPDEAINVRKRPTLPQQTGPNPTQ
jgi:CRISPR-associated endoribonuclease Cas6